MTDFDLTALLPPPFPETTTNSPSKLARQETQMATLRQSLAQSLMPDDNGQEMLKRQMATLDALFDYIVADYALQDQSSISGSQIDRLDLLLKLQAGNARTARALATMDYMAALSNNYYHSSETSRRSGEGRNLGPHDQKDPALGRDDKGKSPPSPKSDEQTKEP